jgi:hypothetical protein
MASAKPRLPVPKFSKSEIAQANDAAILLWNGISYIDGTSIISDRHFYTYFTSCFSVLPFGGSLTLSRHEIHDLVIAAVLKGMLRKSKEHTKVGLERFFNKEYASFAYKYYSSSTAERIEMASKFVVAAGRAYVKRGVSIKAGYRVPFASRLMFFGLPQFLIFNYANELAEKRMGFQTRPHDAYPCFAPVMLDGLRSNWKYLSQYNIPIVKRNKVDSDIIFGHDKTDWWARRVLDLALLIHFGVFKPGTSVRQKRNELVYRYQQKTLVSMP